MFDMGFDMRKRSCVGVLLALLLISCGQEGNGAVDIPASDSAKTDIADTSSYEQAESREETTDLLTEGGKDRFC